MNIFQAGHPFIIAEVGTAHGGSFEEAQKLIDAAAAAGADCVKFQIVYAEEILHPETGFVDLPGGKIRLYDRFKELEVPKNFFYKCKDYCQTCGVGFCASPFGIESFNDLMAMRPFAVKIASPELNHTPLLSHIASHCGETPLILSSGVSKLKDIEKALETIEAAQHGRNKSEIALLHCVTSYPAPATDYNLRLLENLSAIFGISCGVSDHSLDPILVPVLATASGACIIEKHICLDKNAGGLDDPVALPPDDFEKMVKAVRKAENMPKSEVILELSERFGSETVSKCLGDGIKRLAKSEEANYTRTNRSIHFLRDMQQGQKITSDDVAILRTEKVLEPGIEPHYIDQVIGSFLTKDAKAGEGLNWKHLTITDETIKQKPAEIIKNPKIKLPKTGLLIKSMKKLEK